MLPTQERFVAGDRVGPYVDDRLVTRVSSLAAIAALRSARSESCATAVSCISGLKWRKALPSAVFASYIATSALRNSSSHVVGDPLRRANVRRRSDAALDRGLAPVQRQGSADDSSN